MTELFIQGGRTHLGTEITETSLLRELSVALAVLTRLRLRGFGLSLDDYGTGFSSMQQLARIPFTELKIDRSFVHGVHERESVQVMLRSALDMEINCPMLSQRLAAVASARRAAPA